MHQTYFCCLGLDEQHEQIMRQSMAELSSLMALPPLSVEYTFQELPEDARKVIADAIQSHGDTRIPLHVQIRSKLGDLRPKLSPDANPLCLSILCSYHSCVAELIRKEEPDALWGCCNGPVSVTYPPDLKNKYILWHETLHILGANDCHDIERKVRGPTCERKNCIMQYEATQQTVGEWPFLCGANVKRMRDRLEKCGKTGETSG